ncbi:MAG: hypothetical protein Q7J69_04865 [Candidatus Omnitrophota bacterium]|nr:hypothetical protein [Candidatus Omnitrophota bacterium]
MPFSAPPKPVALLLILVFLAPSPAWALRTSQPETPSSLTGLEEAVRKPMPQAGVPIRRARLKVGGILVVPPQEGTTIHSNDYRISEVRRGRMVARRLGDPNAEPMEFIRSQLPKETRYIEPPEAVMDVPHKTARFVIPGDWMVLRIDEWLRDWIVPILRELPIDQVRQLVYPLSELVGNINEWSYEWDASRTTVIELEWNSDLVRATLSDQYQMEFNYQTWLDPIPSMVQQTDEYFLWKASHDQQRGIDSQRPGGMAGPTLSIMRQANEFIIDKEFFREGVGNTRVLLFPKPSAFEEPDHAGVEEASAEGFLQALLPSAEISRVPLVITSGVEERFSALRGLDRLPGIRFQGNQTPGEVFAVLIADTPSLPAVHLAGLEEEIPVWRSVAQLARVDLDAILGQREFEQVVLAILSVFSGLEEDVIRARTGFQEFMAGLKERRSST